MKLFVIGDEDSVLGFRLVGIRGKVVKNREQAEVELHDVLSREDVGLILITERVGEMLGAKIEAFLYRSEFPMVLLIPDRNGPAPGRMEIKEILRKAMGIRL